MPALERQKSVTVMIFMTFGTYGLFSGANFYVAHESKFQSTITFLNYEIKNFYRYG